MIDLAPLAGGLIVSCQAPHGSPLRDAETMARMAAAAVAGGAVAIRADSPEHVAAIRERVGVPIIGLYKRIIDGAQWITPGIEHARALVDAGADIVATDATLRTRPGGGDFCGVLARVREELEVAVMADVDGFDAGLAAGRAGCELVGTTLSGYTADPPETGADPDIALVSRLAAAGVPRVVAEGRIRRPDEVEAAFAAGAFAVVVGTSITEPIELTRRFAAAAPGAQRSG